jgi:hypothetical protein
MAENGAGKAIYIAGGARIELPNNVSNTGEVPQGFHLMIPIDLRNGV